MKDPTNLPTSFDVSPLLSKLERAEDDFRGNLLQRVNLIELDPYYHRSTSDEQSGDSKTRLFLAVAFGKRTVVAQLIASELGRAQDDQGGTDGEGELEWLDVPRKSGGGDPVVVFPPSRAEPLPASLRGEVSKDGAESKEDDAFAEITSCALIPPPAIRLASQTPVSTTKMMTQRAVSVMLGTLQDQVLSVLLKVSDVPTRPNEPSNGNVQFALEYDECRLIKDGGLQEGGSTKYPCVRQILPRAKRYGASFNNDGEEETNCRSRLDDNIQIFHPSLQQQNDVQLDQVGKGEHSGINAISFCRGKASVRGSGGAVNEDDSGATINEDVIWITYGNGSFVKLPSWKPFLGPFDDDGIISDELASMHVAGDGSAVTPFCTQSRSPLDVPPSQMHRTNPITLEDDAEGPCSVNADGYWSLLTSAVSSHAQRHNNNAYFSVEAIVLPGSSATASTAPIAFNSLRVRCNPPEEAHDKTDISLKRGSPMRQQEDEVQSRGMDESPMHESSDDDTYGPVTGTVVEGSAALVKGALGLAFGAVRWGLGSGAGAGAANEEQGHDDTHLDEFMDADETGDRYSAKDGLSLPSERAERSCAKRGVNDLFPWPLGSASLAFSDIPRRFDSATVDPSATLAATTDNLGRVILFDLETKQPIRMLKGMRNASCYFAELPCNDGHKKSRLYLVVHLRQRGVVEVYRLQQGPRISAVAVPEQKDCVVMECQGPASEGGRVDAFLLEKVEGEGQGWHYILDKLVIDDPDVARSSKTPASSMARKENKMQLQIFMQLLAPDTNIQCNAQTVLATFKSIKALSDLGEGLDALAKSSRLESIGIDSSRVHSAAVSHCRSRLQQAKQTESQEGSGMTRKAAISELESKLAYHDRLSRAFRVLHGYEVNSDLKDTGGDEVGGAEMLSPWASEALSWISAASGNEANRTRFLPSSRDVQLKSDNEPLSFSNFATACHFNGDADRVEFTKVKRGRVSILKRLFRPLRQDLFVYKVVNTLIGHLGIEEDFDIQQQYFGEWSSTLPTEYMARSNLYGTWRPMSRWLQDLVLGAHDTSQQAQAEVDDDLLKDRAMLKALLNFCEQMEDLPKAFVLATICFDAVSSATMTLEQKTYGKVTELESVQPWVDLLRKLRVCLLVSLRLNGDVNPIGGINPMTVQNVSRPDQFSAFSWIAKDELSQSHDNQVIVALESACLSSSEAFYPSSDAGDDEQRKEAVFQSSNHQGLSLLFYLKDHSRFPAHLAANRALILTTMWGQLPERLNLLEHAITTLQIVVERVEQFSLAVLVEIYQSRFRPVCRAILFGFGDHELNEELFLPLVENRQWTTVFVSLAKSVLSMIIECMSKRSPSESSIGQTSNEMWPPLRECPILTALAARLPQVHQSSVGLHHTIIFAYEMTRDAESLERMVPSFHSMFSMGSIFSDMAPIQASPQQKSLLDKAIVDHAKSTTRPVVDNFAMIKSVEQFGSALGVDVKYVRTHYLVEMIRLGKDTSINDLLGASSSSLDKTSFAEEVVDIMCSRLNATILSLKQTKNYRGILGLLDAETSRWVREVAAKYPPSQQQISLIATHSMIMRLQTMTGDVEEALSEKIAALSLTSGTLLKAVQAQEQDAVMNV